ncbi:Abi family protein [Flavobacterium rakeshii]|uniref:Abi family protein n=1 Tax=Flavobacterium rakeshii TaxID=1038845 RepID=UPI002E7AC74E|nr:Abi family protein [Flavobacterium rakeshii]MEE1897974.1 Abi family protein [Flavobacterium rakeshii]
MGNVATNKDQQVEKLKERGMTLDMEESKVKEILLDIGYYRLGFYWHPFELDENHKFREGTKFSDALNLYYLDVDLRNTLIRFINRIEINFRTKVVYYVSNKYKKSPTWFIDPTVMSQDFIKNIAKHYDDDFKINNKPIKLHHIKYINDKYAPAWKTLEFFTFGTVLKIYKNLLDESIKKRISEEFGVKNIDKFINLIGTIVFIRNVCAHGGVLFDTKMPKGIAVLPGLSFNNNNRHSLDSAIKVILFMLDSISSNRKNDLESELIDLFNGHVVSPVIKGVIEQEIGYVYEDVANLSEEVASNKEIT